MFHFFLRVRLLLKFTSVSKLLFFDCPIFHNLTFFYKQFFSGSFNLHTARLFDELTKEKKLNMKENK